VFDAIFLGLLFAGWLICAYAPWVVVSVVTRGGAGLGYLPLCLLAGVVGALAVPLLGLDDATGLGLSFAVALLAPSALLAARWFARPAFGATARRHAAAGGDSDHRKSETA
jgi:hypothetical protein